LQARVLSLYLDRAPWIYSPLCHLQPWSRVPRWHWGLAPAVWGSWHGHGVSPAPLSPLGGG